MLHHLKPTGRAGIVLANGSMSSSQNSEGVIRAAMVEADVVEVMVALPGQLFFNTQIPACLWFLVKQKTQRKGEVLFIDARKLATMISRVQSEFTDEVIERIAGTVAAWRGSTGSPRAESETVRPEPVEGQSEYQATSSRPAAMSARKRSKTTTKTSPPRCSSSPRSWASKWPRARSWIS